MNGDLEVPSKSEFQAEVLDLIKSETGNSTLVVVSPVLIAMFGGDLHSAYFLSQLIYWTGKEGRDQEGWIHKNYREWSEEIGVENDSVLRCRKKLEGLGIVTTCKKHVKGAPTVHYRINRDALTEAIRFHSRGTRQTIHGEPVNERGNALFTGNPSMSVGDKSHSRGTRQTIHGEPVKPFTGNPSNSNVTEITTEITNKESVPGNGVGCSPNFCPEAKETAISEWRWLNEKLAKDSVRRMADQGNLGCHIRIWNHARKTDKDRGSTVVVDSIFGLLVEIEAIKNLKCRRGQLFSSRVYALFDRLNCPLDKKGDPEDAEEASEWSREFLARLVDAPVREAGISEGDE